MAVIKKDFNVMGLPMAISRNNPIPLDSTALWYDYAEMSIYAAESATAYVGQILGLVDEVNGTATAYIIVNAHGDLKEVGSAVVVDNHSIALDDENSLALYGFGKAYYKYVPATDTTEAGYKKVNIGDIDPDTGLAYSWKSGLEPKVVIENGEAVIGWYEPNPTTMEGVSASITSLQNQIDANNDKIADLESADNAFEAELAEVNVKLNKVYTKTETDEKIAEAIAGAAHMKRVVVQELPAADSADENTIYMVPSGLQDDDNKYYEYILLEGKFEKVGSWEVDLTNYATKDEVDGKVDKESGKSLISNAELAKLADIEDGAEKNYISSAGTEFTVTGGKLSLTSLPNTIDLSNNETVKSISAEVSEKVAKENGKSLVADDEIAKLLNLPANAEANKIDDVSAELSIDSDRILSIVSVDGSKIVNLSNNADFAALQTAVTANGSDIANLQSETAALSLNIQELNSDLSLAKTDLTNLTKRVAKNETDILELQDILTWKEL